MKTRRRDLDIAKGIGIVLVVLAHAKVPYVEYIIHFHMPFFFFISGMLFTAWDMPVTKYIKRKTKSLLFPFWLWNLLWYPVFYILYYWKNWEVKVFIVDLFEIICTVDKVPFLGATWFLPSLFWTAVLFKVIHSWLFKLGITRIILVGGGIAVFLAGIGYGVTLPYRISRTLICASFYIWGYLYSVLQIEEKLSLRVKLFTAFIAGVFYFIITYFFEASLNDNQYDNFVLYYLAAICAIYAVLNICFLLSKTVNKLIEHIVYLGKNTMGITIWHFLAFRVVILLQIIIYSGSLNWLTDFPIHYSKEGWWILYTIAGIYISIWIDKMTEIIKMLWINKFRNITGKKS